MLYIWVCSDQSSESSRAPPASWEQRFAPKPSTATVAPPILTPEPSGPNDKGEQEGDLRYGQRGLEDLIEEDEDQSRSGSGSDSDSLYISDSEHDLDSVNVNDADAMHLLVQKRQARLQAKEDKRQRLKAEALANQPPVKLQSDAPGHTGFQCPHCRLTIYIHQVFGVPVKDIIRNFERLCQLYRSYPELAATEPRLKAYLDEPPNPGDNDTARSEGSEKEVLRIPPTLMYVYPGLDVDTYRDWLVDPAFLASSIELCEGLFSIYLFHFFFVFY